MLEKISLWGNAASSWTTTRITKLLNTFKPVKNDEKKVEQVVNDTKVVTGVEPVIEEVKPVATEAETVVKKISKPRAPKDTSARAKPSRRRKVTE
jgi:hypothetical protein